MFLMAVLFASTFAVVAPVVMRTSISFHQRFTVRRSRFDSGVDESFEDAQVVPGLVQGPGGQEGAELFLGLPDGLQLPGGVVCGEHVPQPGLGPVGEGLMGAQEQLPVRPAGVQDS